MSTTPLDRPARGISSVRSPEAHAGPISLTADRVARAALALLCVGLAAITWRAWGDLHADTGYELLAGSRTAHGEMPYVDYVYYYGPLAPFLLGGAQLLAGTALSGAIAVGLVLAAAIVALTYAVARRLVAPVPAALAAALTAVAAFGVDNNSYVLPHALSAPLGAAITLVLVLAVDRRARGGDVRWPAVAGICLGLLALARPDATVAAVVGLGAWLAIRAFGNREGRGAVMLDAAAIAAPAVGLVAAVYGAFLTAVPAHELLRTDLFPSNAGLTHSLRIAAPLTASSLMTLVGRLVAYAAATGALVGVAAVAGGQGRLSRVARAGLLLAALAFAAAVLVRPEAVRTKLQLVYGGLPAAAVLATAGLMIARRRQLDARTQTALVLSAVLAVLGAKTYVAFYPFPSRWSAQQAAYAMPFAAIFLAWVHTELVARRPGVATAGTAWLALLALASTGLIARDAHRESATVRGPGGALRAEPAEAGAAQAAVDGVLRRTRPGDPILAAPQLTWLYTLTERRDPLPQLSLLPGALATPEAERGAIARLAGTQVVVVDPRPYVNYAAASFGTRGYDPILGAWLRRAFRRPARLGEPARALDMWRTTP